MPNDRPNQHHARAVEHAISLQGKYGKHRAAHFLIAQGASFRVTVRVLAEPSQRRRTG